MGKQQLKLRIIGLTPDGRYVRAVHVHTGTLYLIWPGAARGCRIDLPDGSFRRGLQVGSKYRITGFVEARQVDGKAVVEMMKPVSAVELPADTLDDIDWDSLPRLELEPNVRNFWLAAEAASAAFVMLDDPPPF